MWVNLRTGLKNDPFRYWLPGQEEKWQQDPFSLPELDERKLFERAKRVLQERGKVARSGNRRGEQGTG